MLKRFTKEERSWILYDVANSAYTLTIQTVLFPILFLNIAMQGGLSNVDATATTQYAKSIYSIVIALLAPILGTIADYQGYKMKFFKISAFSGILFAFLLTLPVQNWVYILVSYILATLGYAFANVFYDAFLVDVTTDERMDLVSTSGYGYGYIGSTIPFILGFIIFVLAKFQMIPISENFAIYIAFAISIVWWAIFTFPMIKNVRQVYFIKHEESPIKKSFLRLGQTFRDIKKYRQITLFLLAYFFYIDGVYTVITAAIPIGKSLNIVDDIMLIGIVLVIQFIAFPFSIIFGRLSTRYGAKRMLSVGILTYFLIAYIGFNLSSAFDMWMIAVLVGFAQGGIQSISRSYFGKLIPKERSNEFFGFFNIFGKFAAILGPILVGFFVQTFDSPRHGMLGIMPLLIIGLIILKFVPESKKTVQ